MYYFLYEAKVSYALNTAKLSIADFCFLCKALLSIRIYFFWSIEHFFSICNKSQAGVLGPCIAFSYAKSLQGGGLIVSFSFNFQQKALLSLKINEKLTIIKQSVALLQAERRLPAFLKYLSPPAKLCIKPFLRWLFVSAIAMYTFIRTLYSFQLC